ncbi:MAG: enoyl-CoA hydratase/isomerase family protein [Planctomycetes bacterium]|nr:enoyl-CoA hydratase/isomerase family protein [Planctomycetota bacterium]
MPAPDAVPAPADELRSPGVRLSFDGPCARITLARPPLHILDMDTITDLAGALAVVEGRGDVAVLVLDADGERAFSAGVDIREHTPDRIPGMLDGFHGAIRGLLALPCVSVAVVQAAALGGGCELAMACDLVLAAEEAKFGQPEIDVGCYPPVAAVLLPRLVGPKAAAELVLAGRPISARRAFELGLANRVVPRAELRQAVDELCQVLLSKSPAVLRLTRQALRAGREGDVESALQATERLYLEELATCPDMAEGVRAFLEKRPPVWEVPRRPGQAQ